jgi:hypothetical protein
MQATIDPVDAEHLAWPALQEVLDFLGGSPDLSQDLRLCQRVLAIAAEHGLPPAELAWRCGREAEHVAETGTPFADCHGAGCPSIYCKMIGGEPCQP